MRRLEARRIDPIEVIADEHDELVRLLRATVASDRYPLSPRIRRLKAVLAKLDPPPPAPEPLPPPKRSVRRSALLSKNAAAIMDRGEVIAEIDIWRAANLLISHHGADAEIEAARKADLMLERGDREGQGVWMRIRRAIVELRAPRRGPAH